MNMLHEIKFELDVSSAQPPALSRAERKRQLKLTAIVNAAAELIASEGLENLTMQKLATRLDLAVGALYRYVASKEALLAQLQIRALRDFDRLYEDAAEQLNQFASANDLPLARLGLCAWIFALSAELSPARFALISGATGIARELLGPLEGLQVLAAALPLFERFTRCFTEAEAAGNLDAGLAQDRALLYFTSVQGLLQARKLGRFSPGLFELERLLPELLETLFKGWGAERLAWQAAWTQVKDFRQTLAFADLLAQLETSLASS